jgi:hypothetical protein
VQYTAGVGFSFIGTKTKKSGACGEEDCVSGTGTLEGSSIAEVKYAAGRLLNGGFFCGVKCKGSVTVSNCTGSKPFSGECKLVYGTTTVGGGR